MALKSGTMKRVSGKLLISVGLFWLAVLMLRWGLQSRVAASKSYTPAMAPALAAFPEALLSLGANAWARQDVPTAIRFLRSGLSRNPMFGGGWLLLAKAEMANGSPHEARKILDYVHALGKNTLRWTWLETLLALDLKAYPVVWQNLNRMIANHRDTANALQLANTLLATEPKAVDQRLDAQNLPAYLKWLMRWRRLDQALAVQRIMAQKGVSDSELDARLSAQLLGQKRVTEALSLVEVKGGAMANPGFESDFAHGPFGWHFSRQGAGWKIKRTTGIAREGSHSLSVVFDGTKNVSFAHLRQIVPVKPGASYQFTYGWKGKNLSTDRGPFFEVYGYDAKGLHVKGPMLLGTHDWERVRIEFTTPKECHAVVIRLRRVRSRKLDNLIEGTVWVDDFELMAAGK